MKKLVEKVRKGMMMASIAFMTLPMNVYAGGLKDTPLVKGSIALLKDATPILLGVEAAIIVVLLIIEGIKYQSADDQEKPRHLKNMKAIFGIGIFIVCVTTLVPAIMSYYTTSK